jgi:replication factor C small subunit
MKVVLLDEMDGASEQFYKALRATIEQFSATARFVGTCNYINKVPDHIQSRFEVISFDPVNREEEDWLYNIQVKRLKVLIGKLEIDMSDEALKEFVKRNFPDMRKMYNRIQGWHIKGIKKIEVSDIKSLNWSFVELFQLIAGPSDPINNYKEILTNYSDKVDDVLQSLGTEFIEWLRENNPDKIKKIPEIIILVAKYQAQRTQVIDQVVNLLALVFEIQQSLNK